MNKLGLIAIIGLGIGCASSGTSYETATGNNAAGVYIYTVDETTNELSIVGFTKAGIPVGTLDLKVGKFVMSPYFADGRTGEVDGRQLNVQVGKANYPHESAGRDPLRLPLVHNPKLNALNGFMIDRRISPVLNQWGITFVADQTPSGGEVAYGSYTDGGDCDWDNLAFGGNGAIFDPNDCNHINLPNNTVYADFAYEPDGATSASTAWI